jgi:uncharacterized protein (DUF2147 family)
MNRTAIAIGLGLACTTTFAQMSPVGLWKSVDEKSGEVTAEIRVVDTAGVVSGKIERQLGAKAKPDDKCTECKDDRKDQPIVGLEIIRGNKKAEGKEYWDGGTIVDPNNGTVYRVKLTPVDGGKKLDVRGYVGAPLFGRTQTWLRAQ